MHGDTKRCVYCLSGPSIRGGLIPDLPGRYACSDDAGCIMRSEQQRIASIPRVCIRCGTTPQGARSLRMLDDESGYICARYAACDERVAANRALLGATA